MLSQKNLWLAASGIVAAGAAFATRSLLRHGWSAATGEDPPMNPADRSTAWSEAIVWTLAASVVSGLSQLAARRTAAALIDDSLPQDRYA